jgi:hypothetical protein
VDEGIEEACACKGRSGRHRCSRFFTFIITTLSSQDNFNYFCGILGTSITAVIPLAAQAEHAGSMPAE